MMMALGLYVFSLSTLAYQELQRRADWRHARSPRFGVRDAAQFDGPGDETISLGGAAVAELQDGRAEIDSLRAMAAAGEAWPLVDGTGRVYGAFVITAIDERHRTFWPNGEPRQIDFGIDLLRVDPPVPNTAAKASSTAGEDQGSLDGEEGQGSLGGEESQGPLA